MHVGAPLKCTNMTAGKEREHLESTLVVWKIGYLY